MVQHLLPWTRGTRPFPYVPTSLPLRPSLVQQAAAAAVSAQQAESTGAPFEKRCSRPRFGPSTGPNGSSQTKMCYCSDDRHLFLLQVLQTCGGVFPKAPLLQTRRQGWVVMCAYLGRNAACLCVVCFPQRHVKRSGKDDL